MSLANWQREVESMNKYFGKTWIQKNKTPKLSDKFVKDFVEHPDDIKFHIDSVSHHTTSTAKRRQEHDTPELRLRQTSLGNLMQSLNDLYHKTHVKGGSASVEYIGTYKPKSPSYSLNNPPRKKHKTSDPLKSDDEVVYLGTNKKGVTCDDHFSPYKKTKKLGSGAAGSTYSLCKMNDCPFVVKEQKINNKHEKMYFNNEVRALTKLKGKTITHKGDTWRFVPQIERYGICEDKYFIIMNQLFKPKKSKEFVEKVTAVINRSLDLGCAHVDTHDGNVMADKDNNPVLIDWGWAWCKQWGKITGSNYPEYGGPLTSFDDLVGNTKAVWEKYKNQFMP